MRFEFGDELLEVCVGAELLQIRVGHQAVGIFVPRLMASRKYCSASPGWLAANCPAKILSP
jgi:hypothetical protein